MEYNEHSNMGVESTMANSGHFRDYEFVPAVIVENKDPKHYGRIKVSAPGSFNANNTDPRLLPWCYPWLMWGQATYSQMEKGAKVWLIRNEKRHDECWYIPMYELHSAAQDFVNKHANEKPEILSFRNNGATQDYMVYDNVASYKIACGGSSVNVSGGGINMSSGDGQVNIGADGKISIGPNNCSEPEKAVLGRSLRTILNGIENVIQAIAEELLKDVSQFTPSIASGIVTDCIALNNSMHEIESESISITESNKDVAISKYDKRSTSIYAASAAASSSSQKTASDVANEASNMAEANVSTHWSR